MTQWKSSVIQTYTVHLGAFPWPSASHRWHNDRLLLTEGEPSTARDTDLGEFRKRNTETLAHSVWPVWWAKCMLWSQLDTSHFPAITNAAEGTVVPCCACALMGKRQTFQGSWCVAHHGLLMVDWFINGQRYYRGRLNLSLSQTVLLLQSWWCDFMDVMRCTSYFLLILSWLIIFRPNIAHRGDTPL